MKQDVLEFTIEKTHELINAFSCSAETKAAAQAWLNSIGTEMQASETQNYIGELEADIMPIDTLISFAESDAGTQVFGENAPHVASHAKEIKSAGAKYCDCPACAAVEAILERKEDLLK
ncbi:molecular chaperone Hsp90 [Diplocloster agilis]|uniref:Molecular chaperone Hsp90 n=1 Tax=Diplocloster agilis TaxID=2850323 RepID=A0A949NCD2_9FIRM|nr:molecular chaperone Hsp90 [Diplocloster agilis]MBU9738557.1 molecular chaperone Hsp90 [Diplocloster agilis]MBU9746800.1 molecular chaperone Hsp90 [Diplocloster agilis]